MPVSKNPDQYKLDEVIRKVHEISDTIDQLRFEVCTLQERSPKIKTKSLNKFVRQCEKKLKKERDSFQWVTKPFKKKDQPDYQALQEDLLNCIEKSITKNLKKSADNREILLKPGRPNHFDREDACFYSSYDGNKNNERCFYNPTNTDSSFNKENEPCCSQRCDTWRGNRMSNEPMDRSLEKWQCDRVNCPKYSNDDQELVYSRQKNHSSQTRPRTAGGREKYMNGDHNSKRNERSNRNNQKSRDENTIHKTRGNTKRRVDRNDRAHRKSSNSRDRDNDRERTIRNKNRAPVIREFDDDDDDDEDSDEIVEDQFNGRERWNKTKYPRDEDEDIESDQTYAIGLHRTDAHSRLASENDNMDYEMLRNDRRYDRQVDFLCKCNPYEPVGRRNGRPPAINDNGNEQHFRLDPKIQKCNCDNRKLESALIKKYTDYLQEKNKTNKLFECCRKCGRKKRLKQCKKSSNEICRVHLPSGQDCSEKSVIKIIECQPVKKIPVCDAKEPSKCSCGNDVCSELYRLQQGCKELEKCCNTRKKDVEYAKGYVLFDNTCLKKDKDRLGPDCPCEKRDLSSDDDCK